MRARVTVTIWERRTERAQWVVTARTEARIADGCISGVAHRLQCDPRDLRIDLEVGEVVHLRQRRREGVIVRQPVPVARVELARD